MIYFYVKYTLAGGKDIRLFVNINTFRVLGETNNKVKALLKQDSRHHDNREAEDGAVQWFVPPLSMEEQYEKKELLCALHRAFEHLTKAQRRRIRAYYSSGMTLEEIAAEEGVHWTSVWESIQAGIKSLKNILDNP